MAVKKLIEVALPLDDINAASAREKSIRHGHPSTLHLWWARRPLATVRAVIWSSLVDDPSSHPEEFPTEEAQAAERERLFDILRELVVWENSNDERVLNAAKAEIQKSCHGDVPALLDPFAGGGAIPLEAQRLGLKAYAQDLNPVAVTINKAMIEIPPRFAGNDPVNPKNRNAISHGTWEGNAGLAADVEYYANWMRDEAFKRVGHLYPKVKVPAEQGGGEATVIAWLWARTVKCPNPACGGTVPLVRSFDLSKKKGKEHHVELACENGEVRFSVAKGKATREGTVGRSKGAVCPHCGQAMNFAYIRTEGQRGRMGEQLMTVVAEGVKGRIYVAPTDDQSRAAAVSRPEDYPTAKLANNPRNFQTPNYGLDTVDKLFTNRQLTALTTFSELVGEAQRRATEDAVAAGMSDDGVGLDTGGSGARAYGEAVGVYLAFVIDKMTDYHSSICSWNSPGEKMRNVFGRQAIPMTWDFAEGNPFCYSSGSYNNMRGWVLDAIRDLPEHGVCEGTARQFDAQSDNGMRGIMVSTDPPYYDNIVYADLSDYFYVWLRQSLRRTYPRLFSTMLVPKAEELVATVYRFDGSGERAKQFFEDGMLQTFRQVFEYSREDVPVTIYYAYKQGEADEVDGDSKVSSSGWETMIAAIIKAGFAITGTWPVRTEKPGRTIGNGTNALASSIVLVCRKRSADAPMATRREFVSTLKRELRPALDRLQQANIAPVDMAQSAIGPGIGVYSRYSKVLEADGSQMSVRSALQIINQELDLYFSDQDSDLDRESRFCVDLYTQCAFNEIKFGEADVLARAKNTSIEGLAERGALYASKGVVRLLGRDEIKPRADHTFTWLYAQQLAHAMETGGVDACAKLLVNVFDSSAENAKALAYRLFTIADKKGWNQEAFAYNSLVVAWPEIQDRAAQLQAQVPVQESLDFPMDFPMDL
jgi:putative DNA methylase